MAKQRHDTETTASKTPLILLAIGALLVAGLVVWALTRTVETGPSSVMNGVPTDSVATGAASSPVMGDTAGTTATSNTIASTSVPITATSSAPPNSEDDELARVPRVSAEDLNEKFKAGSVTIVDVRDSAAYQASHIPGSINLPFASLEGQIDMIPRGKDIVTYCT
jgi:hypothetical protein